MSPFYISRYWSDLKALPGQIMFRAGALRDGCGGFEMIWNCGFKCAGSVAGLNRRPATGDPAQD
jgi:hypothetical protein